MKEHLYGKPWSNKQLRYEALKYNTRNDFNKGNRSAYMAAYSRDIMDSICGHMTPILTYWTIAMLQEEALRYSTKIKFKKTNPSAYGIAIMRGIIDSICGHMSGNIKWTKEMLQEEALLFQSRSDFKNGSSAYSSARRRGMIDEICGHMPVCLRGIQRYSHDRPGTVYFIEVEENLKVGITLDTVKKRFNQDLKNGIRIKIIQTINFSSSIDAFHFEQQLLGETIQHQIYNKDGTVDGPLLGGNTEIRSQEAWSNIKQMMDSMTPMSITSNPLTTKHGLR